MPATFAADAPIVVVQGTQVLVLGAETPTLPTFAELEPWLTPNRPTHLVGQFGSREVYAVAGFVEIGESLEQAAIREVREEVGVEVGELRYFDSQPWPYGRSLMIGYFGRYLGGDIQVDGTEIVEAAWFDVANLPPLPPPISIARRLIESFIARQSTGSFG